MLAITYFLDLSPVYSLIRALLLATGLAVVVCATVVVAPIVIAAVVTVVSYLALPAVLLAAFAYMTYPR